MYLAGTHRSVGRGWPYRPLPTRIEVIEANTQGRLFGSLFVPRREAVFRILTIESVEDILTARLSDISEWALVDRFGPSYQPPHLISGTVADIYEAQDPKIEMDKDHVILVDDFLNQSMGVCT